MTMIWVDGRADDYAAALVVPVLPSALAVLTAFLPSVFHSLHIVALVAAVCSADLGYSPAYACRSNQPISLSSLSKVSLPSWLDSLVVLLRTDPSDFSVPDSFLGNRGLVYSLGPLHHA